MLDIMSWLRPVSPAPVVPPGTEFHDRRKFAAQAHGPNREWKVTSRPLAQVTGICLHQTACMMGERPERYDGTGAHVVVTRAGRVIWLHDWTHRVAAANGWNYGTVSIEIDGLYAGIDGDDSTVWNDPSTPRRETGVELLVTTATAARATIRWICNQLPGVKLLVSHRQSSRDRRNDPGSAIWQRVALPMSKEMGLSDGGPGFTCGGSPIPFEWDPRYRDVPY